MKFLEFPITVQLGLKWSQILSCTHLSSSLLTVPGAIWRTSTVVASVSQTFCELLLGICRFGSQPREDLSDIVPVAGEVLRTYVLYLIMVIPVIALKALDLWIDIEKPKWATMVDLSVSHSIDGDGICF